MGSKGLHMMCWLNTFSEKILNMHCKYILENLLVSRCWFLQFPLKFCLFSQLCSNESSDRMFATSKKWEKISYYENYFLFLNIFKFELSSN